VHDAERADAGVGRGVQVAEADGELVHDVERERLGQRAREVAGEIGAVDVLHDDVVAAVVPAEPEHRDQVAVIQRPGERGLADQRALELGLTGELGRQHLDRDVALEPARAVRDREVDPGHPASTEAADQLVGTDRACHATPSMRRWGLALRGDPVRGQPRRDHQPVLADSSPGIDLVGPGDIGVAGRAANELVDRVDRECARDLAAFVAAHAVGDDEQAEPRLHADRVFVVGAAAGNAEGVAVDHHAPG